MWSAPFFLEKKNQTTHWLIFSKNQIGCFFNSKTHFQSFFIQNTQKNTLGAVINIFVTFKNPINHHKTRNQSETKNFIGFRYVFLGNLKKTII